MAVLRPPMELRVLLQQQRRQHRRRESEELDRLLAKLMSRLTAGQRSGFSARCSLVQVVSSYPWPSVQLDASAAPVQAPNQIAADNREIPPARPAAFRQGR